MTKAPNTYDAEPIPSTVRDEIEALLNSGDLFRYTNPGKAAVPRLERAFAEMMGTKYALAVSSCSAAMFLSMRAMDLKPGARVAIPGFTFAAVPSSVVNARCVPVLVEVGENYRIDLAHFHKVLEDGVDAILVSHMRGHTSDMDVIMNEAERYGIDVIEDAAHSLGTTWNGRNIGTIGRVGCFSFQSYKLINAGEGGMLITDDDELFARAVIMSGAYEHYWKTHPGIGALCEKWQNQLPLYNLRMQNLSATVVYGQLAEVPRRVRDGRANHDYLAAQLNASPWFRVPPGLPQELRAPDSIQFSVVNFSEAELHEFAAATKDAGVSVGVFGLSTDNARAFWNWKFLGEVPELPKTREMLMKTCDLRLPARLRQDELDYIATTILKAAARVKDPTTRVA